MGLVHNISHNNSDYLSLKIILYYLFFLERSIQTKLSILTQSFHLQRNQKANLVKILLKPLYDQILVYFVREVTHTQNDPIDLSGSYFFRPFLPLMK